MYSAITIIANRCGTPMSQDSLKYHAHFILGDILYTSTTWSIVVAKATAPSYFRRDVTGSKLFCQFCMAVQPFSHRGSAGYRAVCAHPSDYPAFHLPQLVHITQTHMHHKGQTTFIPCVRLSDSALCPHFQASPTALWHVQCARDP